MRIFLALLGLIALLTQAAHAQHKSAPTGPSAQEKAALAEKEAERKATENAYKAAIQRTPDSTQKVDPWATVRAPPSSSTPARQ